jgi:excisionase family DNA binding protein
MAKSEAPNPAPLLTVDEVAARLQMTPRYVRELVRDDRLVAI